MRFEVEFDREEDGRWIAEITNLPGAMAYGETKEIAVASAEAIAGSPIYPMPGKN